VDAWAGLDPLMAQTEVEKGSKLFHRDISLNSYGVLNVREEFAKQYPAYVKRVLAAYEKSRLWAIQNPAEFRALYSRDAKINDAIAAKVLGRTDISKSGLGDEQKKVIAASGDVLKKSGVISSSTDVAATVNVLIDPQYVREIVASK
jgi:sulfonate transport system substrate-binding protein